MNEYSSSVLDLGKKPSAFLPMAMSTVALTVVLGSVTLVGVAHDADEGPVAHIFQLLMAGQVPIVAYFVVKWLPRVPRQTLYILAMQIGAALAAMAPVYILSL
jgi:hypothetical protein